MKISMTTIQALLLVVAAASFGAPSTLVAQEAEGRTAQARAEYNRAAEAFGAGRFGEALDRFSRAYEFSPRAELLYNIGTAHDRLGHREDAVRFYRAYLDALREAQNRAYTEARIAVLEGEIEEAAAAEERVAEERRRQERVEAESVTQIEPEEPAEPDQTANIPAIVLVSAAGATAVAAVVTGVMALGQRADLESACTDLLCDAEEQGALDRLNALTITTDVLIGVAAALAVTGVVLFVVGGDDDNASVSCGFGGCEAQVRF